MDGRIAVLSAAVFGGVLVAGAYGMRPAENQVTAETQPAAQVAAEVPAQVVPAPAVVSEAAPAIVVPATITATESKALVAVAPQPRVPAIVVSAPERREDGEVAPRTTKEPERDGRRGGDDHEAQGDD